MIEIDENEIVVEIVWDHWFVLVGKLAILIFAVLFPFLVVILFDLIPLERILTIDGSVFALKGFFITFWLIIVWMVGWNVWTSYYLNVLLITDIRIFDITQMGFFRRQSASFRIDHIQNVTVEQTGIIPTLLNYGTIRFETAGENINFVAKYIPAPSDIKRLIDGMQDGEMSRSKEVHLHPDTIDLIAPGQQQSASEQRNANKIGTFVDRGM